MAEKWFLLTLVSGVYEDQECAEGTLGVATQGKQLFSVVYLDEMGHRHTSKCFVASLHCVVALNACFVLFVMPFRSSRQLHTKMEEGKTAPPPCGSGYAYARDDPARHNNSVIQHETKNTKHLDWVGRGRPMASGFVL